MSETIDEMVRSFQFYVRDRQIGLAENLSRHFEDRNDGTPFKQSGYVILSVASAYFEMIQQFMDGKESVEEDDTGRMRSHSWDFFKRGFKEVYPDPQWTDASIKKIYKVVRCGMYHGGMPKGGCHLSRYFQPGFHLCRNEIHVNRRLSCGKFAGTSRGTLTRSRSTRPGEPTSWRCAGSWG